ncbi:hypothetical protein FANTH_4640 [Fusarium anthophilum]|uniref:Uncharacterized protein n=1 Tax=Fusarium anthophilum TaxID=48485 RepID=A0A8H5E7X8_9HYPO|nr:hypothetical protein FANTH_4640 [Fusarium anthophilum]
MVFSPSLITLSPEASRVMYGVINEIGLPGAPIEMAGPYVCTGGSLSSVYGMWIGPDAVPGGYSIEFSVVGPYPPLEDGAEAPSGSTEAGTKITWTSVNFDQLSPEELKCAEGKLSKAESDNRNDEEALKLIKIWQTQVSDAWKNQVLAMMRMTDPHAETRINAWCPVLKRTTNDEISPVPPKKPRLNHTIENTVGTDLRLPLVVDDEALELPRTLKYPLWMELPDSTENSVNEILATDGLSCLLAKKLDLKHTVESTIGDDLVLELKPYEEVIEKQKSLYGNAPWEEISDSNEDSESEESV